MREATSVRHAASTSSSGSDSKLRRRAPAISARSCSAKVSASWRTFRASCLMPPDSSKFPANGACRFGFEVPLSALPSPEMRLYEVLSIEHGDGAHSQYNALIRRLVSFERAAACVGR